MSQLTMTSRSFPVPTITPTKPRFSVTSESAGNDEKLHMKTDSTASSWDDESILAAAQQVVAGQSNDQLENEKKMDMFDFTDNDVLFPLNPRQLPKNCVTIPIKISSSADENNDSSDEEEDDSKAPDLDGSWESEDDSSAHNLDGSWESEDDSSAHNINDSWESQTTNDECNDHVLHFFPTPETPRQNKQPVHPTHIRAVIPVKGKVTTPQFRTATPFKGKFLPQQESREPEPDTWGKLSQGKRCLTAVKRDNEASTRCKTPALVRSSSNHQFPWTFEEEEIIRECRKKNIKYSVIQAQLPGRTCSEIRDHFENVIDPDLLTTPLTIQEKRIILEKRQRFGNRWNFISTFLPRRSVDQIKKFWLTTKLAERRHFRKSAKSE